MPDRDPSEGGDEQSSVHIGLVIEDDGDDNDTVLIRVPRGVVGAIGLGVPESVLVEPVPGEDCLEIRHRPICEWCGCYIDETGGTCPARDDGIECDSAPAEWYEKVFSAE